MAMRMIVDNFENEKVASLGGLGIDELRWLKPVYPGDVLSLETEVLEKNPSKSRPEMGIFRTKTTVFNQNDEPVMVYTTIAMVATRPV